MLFYRVPAASWRSSLFSIHPAEHIEQATSEWSNEKSVYSPKPIAVPSFREPSLAGLVEQLKAELGDVRDTVDADTATRERFLDIGNHMDNRRTPAAVDAAWRERKRKVIANPDLLWPPGFVLPPYLDMQDDRHKIVLFDYEIKQRIG